MAWFTRRRFLEAAAAAPLVAAGLPRVEAAAPVDKTYELLLRAYRARQEEFAAELGKLADDCEAKGFASDAADLRALAKPLDERALQFDELPETVLPEISTTFQPDEREWRSRLRSLRQQYAADLFKQSVAARQKERITFAYRLVRETAFHDSDHERARSLLGFVKVDDRWMTPFRKQMLKEGKVWHAKFGWLPEKDVARYDAGERFCRGQWMSAAREDGVRKDFNNAWEVRSEHFLIKTNHSLERAVEISVALERFHAFFVRTFAAVFVSPSQLRQLFEGGLSSNPQPPKKHVVHYYRTREEFVERLVSKQREVIFSNGIYMPSDRIAYFFHKPDSAEELEETMYHETTHQLLSESIRGKPVAVGINADFWVVEGLACYLESFHPADGTFGDPRHVRVAWAKKYFEEGVYLDMEPFTAMGQAQFQCARMPEGEERVEQLRRHYAQAAGLCHFLMHYEDGLYREALVTYLSQVYHEAPKNRNRVPTLAELTGVSFEELDAQYADHITQ